MINVSTPMFDVIKSDLAELDEGLAGAVASSFELVTEVGAHLVSSGGKRIRPALCLLAARGGLKFDLKKVLPMAEALELIHTASLVHDDVVDESDIPKGLVSVGCKVKVQDYNFDEKVEYHIVGSAEADPMHDRISNESPVGKALIGKKKGDVVDAVTPNGSLNFKILSISRD